MSILSKIFGDANARFLAGFRPAVEKINQLESEMQNISRDDFFKKTEEFKKRIAGGASPDTILPDAFALAREAARRTLGQRHFDVQMLGGIILHKGQIAEMRTGEGKTLTATLPVYLNALIGKGVHVVTVNDYLARRDAVWMGQIYYALGMSVGCINHDASFIYDPSFVDEKDKERDTLGGFKVVHEFLKPCTRREAYAADITYGTNNEFGFDYLRDNMAYSEEQMTQRGHYFAIVDEVDSILIDEARTPLIISAPDEESAELYKVFATVVPQLTKGPDYTVDEKMKAATLTEEGIEKVERILGIQDIYTEKGIRYVHHLEQALRAQGLFQRDRDYVVKDGQVIIVDEFTGRLMPGRRWSEGLHQAIEAKEGVPIQRESRTLASITFQNYFRLYEKLAGMTGTAETSAEEFHKVYTIDVTTIPTNKPMIRQDLPDKVYQTEQGKFQAIVRAVRECYEKKQPVLVGTISIEKNERISELLKREGVPHQVLNAKHHEQEGVIIAQAGKPGAVTIATNMAGRGVDIVLGGNPPSPDEAAKVREARGLFILGTERHEARRIDDQLRGRAGRQGDPGMSQFFVSLEDDLMRVFGSERIKKLMGTFGIPEDEPIENKMVSRSIESAQAKIEGFNFDARKHVLEYDDVMNKQREVIYRMRREALRANGETLKEKVWGMIQKNTDESGREEAERVYRKKEESLGESFTKALRFLLLQVIDRLWMDHLEIMDYTRSSVRLRAYGNRDPLVEYKNEAYTLFREFNAAVERLVAENVLKISEVQKQPQRQIAFSHPSVTALSSKQVNTSAGASAKVGRNDPCPCGSGKKYKKCHGGGFTVSTQQW